MDGRLAFGEAGTGVRGERAKREDSESLLPAMGVRVTQKGRSPKEKKYLRGAPSPTSLD